MISTTGVACLWSIWSSKIWFGQVYRRCQDYIATRQLLRQVAVLLRLWLQPWAKLKIALKFQKMVNIVGKIMLNFKNVKVMVLANAKILEKDTNFLFGEKCQACLIKSLHNSRTPELQKALCGQETYLQEEKSFYRSGVSRNALVMMRSPFRVAPWGQKNVVEAPPSPVALHRGGEAGQYPKLWELKPAAAMSVNRLESVQNPSLSKAKQSK